MENLLHLKSKSLFKDLESFLTLFLIQGKGGDLSVSEWTVENILAEIGDNKKHISDFQDRSMGDVWQESREGSPGGRNAEEWERV